MALTPSDETRIRSEFDRHLQKIQKLVKRISKDIRAVYAEKELMTTELGAGGKWDVNNENEDLAALHGSFSTAWTSLYSAFSTPAIDTTAMDLGGGMTNAETIMVILDVILYTADQQSAVTSVEGKGMLDVGESPFIQE